MTVSLGEDKDRHCYINVGVRPKWRTNIQRKLGEGEEGNLHTCPCH
jgi:hypothetical protein